MMYANVFTKTTRDRVAGMVVAGVSIALMLWMGTAVYVDMDIGAIYGNLPSAFFELMGIPPGADAAGIAFGAIYSMMGAFILAGLAISMGTASIAGEEVKGTLGLLLGNPRSRSAVLVAKALSLVAVVAVGGLLSWAAGYLVPGLLSVDMAGYQVGALVLHMSVNAVFYGYLAMMVGSWTGNSTASSSTAVAVMVIGYLAAGILPLTENLEGLAKLSPWYLYSRSAPVVNGVDWGDLAILSALTVAFLAIALVGVNRRDLKQRSTRISLLDRARSNDMTKRIADRIGGSARVSGVIAKTVSDHQGLLVICLAIMFWISLMMGPIYGLMESALAMYEQIPEALVAMIGGADMTTAAGFLQAEIFSITMPITFGVLTIHIGATAIAGEEEKGTMDLLMASPITRQKVIVDKSIAMVGYAAVLGLATFLGTWVTVLLGRMDVSIEGIAAATLLGTLFGLVLGAVAILFGSLTGRARVAAYTATSVGLVGYFVSSFLPLSDRYADWAKLSPYHYFLGSDPLINGMNWGHAAILTGLFILLIGLSIPAWQRRDLR